MDLNEIRVGIDAVDKKIVELLNERFEYVKKVGEWKKNKNHEIYVPEREKALLEKLSDINKGPISNEVLRSIYREIMSGAIALEQPLNISYLGPEASFSQLAALAKFGRSVEYSSKSSISDVFKDVEIERSDYGCVPIENSTEGAVNHTLDMFINSNVSICAEINMKIHHNLMASCKFNEINKLYSHAQVLGQCRNWILEKLPNVELIEVSSTTKAAKFAMVEKKSAAIASTLAAEKYNLNILFKNIEDNADNTTRFMVISKQKPKVTNDDKTSLCFAIKDKIGALYECLVPFKNKGVTLTLIESRPSKKKNWEYFFFVDMLGHVSDENIKEAINELEEMCQFVKILGSYPKSNFMV